MIKRAANKAAVVRRIADLLSVVFLRSPSFGSRERPRGELKWVAMDEPTAEDLLRLQAEGLIDETEMALGASAAAEDFERAHDQAKRAASASPAEVEDLERQILSKAKQRQLRPPA
jgi:hypothetical protein